MIVYRPYLALEGGSAFSMTGYVRAGDRTMPIRDGRVVTCLVPARVIRRQQPKEVAA